MMMSGPVLNKPDIQDENGEWVSGSAGRTRSLFNGARRFCQERYGGPSREDPQRPVIMRAASTVTGSIQSCLVALMAKLGP